MIDIEVPKFNSIDTAYVLVEWLAEDGQPLERGDPVAVVETSKAAEELCCEHGGILQTLTTAPADCDQGSVIAHLFDSEAARQEFLAGRPAERVPDPARDGEGSVTLTEPARLLAERHGIDRAALSRLGRRVVREADVRRLLDEAPASGVPSGQPANRAQRAVAAAVVRSHREIPTAFTAVVVPVDAVMEAARELSRRTGALIGLPEWLVAVLGRLSARFPQCYGTPSAAADPAREAADYPADYPADGPADPVADPAAEGIPAGGGAHVGVTVDVGRGLFAPVVKNAADRTLLEIADLLMDFRIKAMRDTFRTDDLSGADILLALNNDDDVLFAQPIIFPGQTCAVSLGGTRREAVFTEDGTVVPRSVAVVGLAYDHRFVNGSTAAAFLGAIKEALGSPASLAAPTVPGEGDRAVRPLPTGISGPAAGISGPATGVSGPTAGTSGQGVGADAGDR